MVMQKIVVVDDDPFILQLLSEYLRKEGYEVTSFLNGKALIPFVRSSSPDCMILDIMIPGIDGLTLLTELRSFTEMPIIMISARGEENDRIQGLELGCSDFLSKPFNPRELVGRVKAMLRLSEAGYGHGKSQEASKDKDKGWAIGNVRIEPEFRRVTIEGAEVPLTSREFELFQFLASYPERPFEREHLIQQIWQYDFLGDIRVVDDLVKRVRRKLSDFGSTLMIDTVWGFGYKVSVRQV